MNLKTKLEIFKKDHSYLKLRKDPRLKKFIEQVIKTICVLSIPLPMVILAFGMWWLFFFSRSWHFSASTQEIVMFGWLPLFGILYSILMIAVFGTVWKEYKTIRNAVKDFDINTFMNLRDERMSPLIYTLSMTFSSAITLAFMGFRYHNFLSGALIMGSASYLLYLLFFVIIEIDNPCSGFWYIKSIPAEWLKIDPKKWRERRNRSARKDFEKALADLCNELADEKKS